MSLNIGGKSVLRILFGILCMWPNSSKNTKGSDILTRVLDTGL